MNVIPVVNENDTVSISEIKNESKLGDNDTLAAYVAQIVEADLTILLSDIDGFYQNLDDNKPLDEILSINENIWNSAGGSGSSHGKGGMFTKVRAADMIMKSGHQLIIAKAGSEMILNRIMDGENIGTLFHGSDRTLDGRKRWIAFNMDLAGSLTVDDGAAKALVTGKKSLLAAGIVSFNGVFEQGDAVEIIKSDGEKIGRGISNYTSNEIGLIMGKKSTEIKKILEDTFYDEVVHRDNMIIF
jgi:glutamate 5-kinase